MPRILHFSLKSPDPTVYEIDTETYVSNLFNEINTFEKILNNYQFLPLTDIAAVFVSFWSGEPFQPQYQIVAILMQFYQNINIPIFCCSWNSIFSSALLLACVEEYGEKSLEENMEFILILEENVITKFHICHCKSYYKIISIDGMLVDKLKVPMDQPKTFIAYAEISENDVKQDGIKKQKHIYNTVLKLFQQQSKTLTLISQKINTLKALVKKALHLLEGKTFKYDVATIASTDYGLIHRNVVCNMPSFTTSEAFERSLCSSNLHEIIPLKKTIICYQDFYDIVLVHFDVGRYGIHQEFSILESGSAISLSIDKYFMASVEIEKRNTAVIHGAMICFNEKAFTAQMIKNDKLIDIGIKNIPLAISFTNGRIQIGDEAVKLIKTQNSYVISDLLKILKTPSKDLKADPKWGFQISQINDETVLEFDTFKGRRKASPTFLFAFFLRYSVKIIEVISGEMPKTTVIVSKNLNDNFRQQLIASCKSAKINPTNVQIHEYKIVEIKS